MSRYTTDDAIKLFLRAPENGVTSWNGDVYDDLLTNCRLSAERKLDDLTGGWSPFDAAAAPGDRTFLADGAAVYGVLVTDPFTVAPTEVRVEHADSALNMRFTPQHDIAAGRSGRNLIVAEDSPVQLIEGVRYTLRGATWHWAAVPEEVKLAAQRIAGKLFMSMRSKFAGMIEVGGGEMMYEPRYDDTVRTLLGPWLGENVA